MMFLSLPEVHEAWKDCKSEIERIMYLIRNMHTMTKKSEPYTSGEYNDFFEAAQLDNLVADEAVAYSNSYYRMLNDRAALNFAAKEAHALGLEKGLEEGRAEGREEGRAEGLSEGRAEAMYDAARRMKVLNVPIDDKYHRSVCSRDHIAVGLYPCIPIIFRRVRIKIFANVAVIALSFALTVFLN